MVQEDETGVGIRRNGDTLRDAKSTRDWRNDRDVTDVIFAKDPCATKKHLAGNIDA